MNFMLTPTNKHCREGKGKLFMLLDRGTMGLNDIPNVLKEVYDREECLELFLLNLTILLPPFILPQIFIEVSKFHGLFLASVQL